MLQGGDESMHASEVPKPLQLDPLPLILWAPLSSKSLNAMSGDDA